MPEAGKDAIPGVVCPYANFSESIQTQKKEKKNQIIVKFSYNFSSTFHIPKLLNV